MTVATVWRGTVLAALMGGLAACTVESAGQGAKISFPTMESMRLGSLTLDDAVSVYGSPRYQTERTGTEPAGPDGKQAYSDTGLLRDDAPRALHWEEVNLPPSKVPYDEKSATYTYSARVPRGRVSLTHERRLSLTFHNGRLSQYSFSSRLSEPAAKRWEPSDLNRLVRGHTQIADVLVTLGQPTSAGLCRLWDPSKHVFGHPSTLMEYAREENQEDRRTFESALLRFDPDGVLADYGLTSSSFVIRGTYVAIDPAEGTGRSVSATSCRYSVAGQ